MLAAKIPTNETGRLFTLESLKVLDTPKEERFDRITRIAKHLFGVPIALVSLIDSQRQWFKSNQGFNGDEYPREKSFCGHTILSRNIFVVEDTSQDERFCDNPLVINDPNIAFYAGYPLTAGTDFQIGTLAIMDYLPRQFTSEDAKLLQDLAKLVDEELTTDHNTLIDNLTGIANKNGFLKYADYTLNLCKRLDKPMTLITFDLDHFSEINEKFGQEEGNRILKYFARILMDSFRDSDVISRLGNDEFAILCANTAEADASVVVDRLKEKLIEYNKHNHKAYILDVSYGIVPFNARTKKSLKEISRQADLYMFLDKKKKMDH